MFMEIQWSCLSLYWFNVCRCSNNKHFYVFRVQYPVQYYSFLAMTWVSELQCQGQQDIMSKAAACRAGIPNGCQFKSQLLCFQPSCRLRYFGKSLKEDPRTWAMQTCGRPGRASETQHQQRALLPGKGTFQMPSLFYGGFPFSMWGTSESLWKNTIVLLVI